MKLGGTLRDPCSMSQFLLRVTRVTQHSSVVILANAVLLVSPDFICCRYCKTKMTKP